MREINVAKKMDLSFKENNIIVSSQKKNNYTNHNYFLIDQLLPVH